MARSNTISTICTGGYKVEGLVGMIPISFLLDTGASVTLLRKDTWERVKAGNTLQLSQWAGQRLVGVDGSPLQVFGQAEVELTLVGKQFLSKVLVVSPLTTEAILGLDFLQEHRATIDLGNRKLLIGRDQGTSVPLHKPSQRAASLRVHLVDVVHIPPCSEVLVMAGTTEPIGEGTYLVEGSRDRPGAMVARALVDPKGGCLVPVNLLNPRAEAVTLKAGADIATVVPIEPPVTAATVEVESAGISPEKEEMLGKIVEENGECLTVGEKEQLLALLLQYADVFATTRDDLGRTGKLKHDIDTAGAHPVRQRVRRIPPQRRQEVQELLNKMLENGVIKPSNSPWASPVVLVRKKDGSLRFCIDYRKLNQVTTKDAYPLPRVDDTLNALAGSQWFTTLDLLSGYWQVEVAEKDKGKTAFCTTEGLYEFNVMPFGLCNAPATFQRLMDLVLAGLDWSHCLVFIDDLVILGATFRTHLQNLQAVFQRLRDSNLRVKPSKCSFLQSKVHFLGHVVSRDGVSADPEKVDKVANWPVPTSTKEVQQFLGLAGYYRRFVKSFADIARPLHRLTERNAVFRWTKECEAAFTTLRKCLISSPVLAYPDHTKPFILDTDASNTGIGGVLSQQGPDGEERVIAYASRVLSKPERNYCVTRRELLAAIYFTQHFRLYLLGQQFTLRTDHGSLTWLKSFKEPDGQLARWLEHLQQFDFEIVHRPGHKHSNADALSRHPCHQCGRDTHGDRLAVAMVALSAPSTETAP